MDKVRQAVKTHGPTFAKIIAALLVLTVLFWAIFPNRSPDWTGFGKHPVRPDEALAKTLWDWMGLLFVPFVLGVAGYWLSKIQKDTELKIAKENRQKDQEIAREGRRQTAFENYLDRIKGLLLDKPLHFPNSHILIDSPDNRNLKELTRTLTLNILRELSSKRNQLVLQFLQEASIFQPPFEVNFNQSDLRSVELACADLRMVKFSGANLSEADFAEADLTGADLCMADLREACFSGTNLQDANLDFAILLETKFRDIKDEEFASANIAGASFAEVDLQGFDMGELDLTRTNFRDANLTECNFEGAIFHETVLQFANLQKATLSSTNSSTKFTKANLFGADLTRASLENASLRHCDLIDAVLFHTRLKGADLSYTKLNGAKLMQAKCMQATLIGANLADKADLTGADFSGANLTGATLTEAILAGTNFTNAILVEADLTEADLFNATLHGANLFRATVSEDKLRFAKLDDTTTLPSGKKFAGWPESTAIDS